MLNATLFYAEQGGQTHDTGAMAGGAGDADMTVTDVQRHGAFVLHTGDLVVCGLVLVCVSVLCSLRWRSVVVVGPAAIPLCDAARRAVRCRRATHCS